MPVTTMKTRGPVVVVNHNNKGMYTLQYTLSSAKFNFFFILGRISVYLGVDLTLTYGLFLFGGGGGNGPSTANIR